MTLFLPMILTLSPIRRDAELVVQRSGMVLQINGKALDLSSLTEDGAILPMAEAGCDWLAGDIRHEAGSLHLTLALPHGPVPFPPPPDAMAVLYPAPLTVLADGPVDLPAWTPPAETDG